LSKNFRHFTNNLIIGEAIAMIIASECVKITIPECVKARREHHPKSGMANETSLINRLLVFNTSPLECILTFPNSKVLGDFTITKHETIGKSTASPIG
jgi:hypothetical protein